MNLKGGYLMENWLRSSIIAGVAVACALSLAPSPLPAQAPAYRAPRTADGKPDLNGIWEALNTADWDLVGHGAAMGPVASLGAVFAKPPGLGVVEGDEIPYLPATAAKKKENQANWTKLDGGTNGPVAWHAWKLSDEDQQPWNGFFFVLKTPGKAQEYSLYVHVHTEEDENAFLSSGWTSSGGIVQNWA